jgi:hypothetical protein
VAKKANSRWGKGGLRQRMDIKLEDSRWTRNWRGFWRLVTDQPNEVVYCLRRHEGYGWRGGARVTRRA